MYMLALIHVASKLQPGMLYFMSGSIILQFILMFLCWGRVYSYSGCLVVASASSMGSAD